MYGTLESSSNGGDIIPLNFRGKIRNKLTATQFNTDFTSIRTLHSNIDIETDKPALLFLTETKILLSSVEHLHYPDYCFDHNFKRPAGVCVYIREDINFHRLSHLEESDLSTL
ncbi:unnamed protein product [Pieris brassicae]|uniref:Uncharacterized protein n=1 Tax=Pieris brassicae TaxID=7116 RepID=A0A9P0TGW9_PIEBR|nr:unnamed protein product [Pieris brassicae]